MNVSLDINKNIGIQPESDSPMTRRSVAVSESGNIGAFSVDIAGSVKGNQAYAGQGKSLEDVKNVAKATDLAIQTEYATVMSNSMSGKDYAELTKDGYQPGKSEMKENVTILDEIKATLAQAGVVIEGYNDDLDYEELKNITGSESLARSLTKAFHESDAPVTKDNVIDVLDTLKQMDSITELSQAEKKYLVMNGGELTPEALYHAKYSAGDIEDTRQSYGYYAQNEYGYMAKRAEEYDWKALETQMNMVISDAGLPEDEESMKQARYLIENGFALTKENLSAYAKLENLSLPLEKEQLLMALTESLASGKSAAKADLTVTQGGLLKAVAAKEIVEEATDEDLQKVVSEGKKLNLESLRYAHEQNKMTNASEKKETAVSTPEPKTDAFLHAKRVLEEVRLQMTVSANYSLIKKGIAIDTTQLSELVEKLKQEELEKAQSLFPEEVPEKAREDLQLFRETVQVRAQLYLSPLAVIGEISEKENEMTLPQIKDAGDKLRAAQQSYETLMTAPRRDLGDSIQKAFGNVDEILKDMGLETTKENQRTIRILGYNRMEMNAENFEKIQAADEQVTKAVKELTPGRVLSMIREGRNPLDMSIEQLTQYLQSKAEDDDEKYSQFLYRMDKAGEITSEEKESFIGIYRLFRQIEKSDGAVIGSLIHQNGELTLSGLLSAVRTKRDRNMDIRVDDNYGALRDIAKNGVSIDEQIMTAYEYRISEQIYDKLDPLLLRQMDLNKDQTLEKTLADMEELAAREENLEESEKLDKAYLQEELKDFRNLADIKEETFRYLMEQGRAITPEYLMAAESLLSRRGTVFEKLRAYRDELLESFTDRESAKEGYISFTEKGEALLEEQMRNPINTFLDLKLLKNQSVQLSLAAALHSAKPREEKYHIPVEVNGRVTDMEVKLLHGEGKGRVVIAMDHEMFGKIGGEFEMTGTSSFSGYLVSQIQEGMGLTERIRNTMSEELEGTDISLEALELVRSEELRLEQLGQRSDKMQEDEVKAPSNYALYRLAKAFVTAVEKA